MALLLAAIPGKVWAWLAAVFFASLGTFIALRWGWQKVALARASRSWPTVPGTVLAATLVRVSGSDNGDTYRARIEYAYVVEGTRFTGDRVCAGDQLLSGSVSGANKVLARYPVGTEVPAAYDPADPASSLLEPGSAGTAWILTALGTLFAGIGVAIAVWAALNPERLR